MYTYNIHLYINFIKYVLCYYRCLRLIEFNAKYLKNAYITKSNKKFQKFSHQNFCVFYVSLFYENAEFLRNQKVIHI